MSVRYKPVHWTDGVSGFYSAFGHGETFPTVAEAAQHLESAGDYVLAVDGILRELNDDEKRELSEALRRTA